ncbi:MAG: DUF1549 domain-containing protein, partial [Verrucomicrobiota bacterium]
MNSRLKIPLFILTSLAWTTGFAVQAAEVQGVEFFESKIRPLLVEHCYQCHSQEANKGKANLYLDSRAAWQIGGDSGPAIVPGKPHESLLFQSVTHTGHVKMPPKTRLSDAEVEALRTWIVMGAPDPREGDVEVAKSEIDLEEGREFWSFKPPVATPTPIVKNTAWSESAIDRHILARLESEGIEPATEASPRTLLRRVYYDLIGLPPTPDEMNAFLEDASPEAFEKVVDHLLSRPEFGERWGRHWLDVARFAESTGGGRSMVLTNAWRFRDYVIESFNHDKPYNQFIREQIAGDILPFGSVDQRNAQLVGSGYLVLGAINYELQDKELLRMEIVDEQIDTFGRTFLGMTLGCARCHDHKFDPIPTTDYYALAGIFQSTNSMGEGAAAAGVAAISTAVLESPESGKLQERKKSLAAVRREIDAFKKQKGTKNLKGPISPHTLPGLVVDNKSAQLTGDWKKSTSAAAWVGEHYIHDLGENKGRSQAVFAADLARSGQFEVLVSYSPSGNRSKTTPVTVSHAEGETTVKIDQTLEPDFDGCFVSVGTFRFSHEVPARVTISNKGTQGVVIADAVSFAAPQSEELRKTGENQKHLRAKLASLTKEQATLEAEIKRLQPITMAPSESKSPADGHVHIRGQIRNKGAEVPRGFLTVAMNPDDTTPEIADESSG